MPVTRAATAVYELGLTCCMVSLLVGIVVVVAARELMCVMYWIRGLS